MPNRAFDENAAVEAAFGCEMPLPALGIGLDRVGHVLAKQPAMRIAGEEVEGLGCFARLKDRPQRVERRAVPEDLVARLRRQPVDGPHVGGEKGVDRARFAIEKAHGERHADPGAEPRVAVVVAIGVEALDVAAEVFFDGLGQGVAAAVVLGGLFRLAQARARLAAERKPP